MTIDKMEMRRVYDAVEDIRGKLNSLYFRMEEADVVDGDKQHQAYVAAKDVVSAACDQLMDALDITRDHAF